MMSRICSFGSLVGQLLVDRVQLIGHQELQDFVEAFLIQARVLLLILQYYLLNLLLDLLFLLISSVLGHILLLLLELHLFDLLPL